MEVGWEGTHVGVYGHDEFICTLVYPMSAGVCIRTCKNVHF